jgi:hypothetical protein
MKALFLTAIGETEVRDIEKPVVGAGQLLLKISKVARISKRIGPRGGGDDRGNRY